MSGPPPMERSNVDTDDWLITYADAITLLMAFFVVMFSISEPNAEKFEAVTQGIRETLYREKPSTPLASLSVDVDAAVASFDGGDQANASSTARGLNFEFKSTGMFAPGSADFLPEAEPLLDRVAQLLSLFGTTNFDVEVEGHTDDVPINTARFPSNWELSAARATSVVRFFIERGVDPTRLRATGYADTKPKAPNLDDSGRPIPANRELNRRIVIRVDR